jgi:MoxR-like ATPase
VQDYAIRIVEGTHPDRPATPEKVKRFVRFGASPRGAQACLVAAKIRALGDGRFAASLDDVRAVAHACLRHRIILGFEGEAERVRPDALIDDVIRSVPEASPASGGGSKPKR